MANIAPLLQYLDIPGMRGAAAAQLTPWAHTPPPMQFSGLSQDLATMQNARADIGTQPPRYQPPLPIINQPINPPPLPWFAYAGGQALPPNDRIPAPPQRAGMAPETSVSAQRGLPQRDFNPQQPPAQVEVDEQVGGMDPRYGIQPRTDQGFGSYQPSAADFGEKQAKQQSPFNSDAGMWGILAAGLGILANNYGNYGQAGPAIGKGGMMGLNTFLEQRQIAERNKFAQQELDQRNQQIQQAGDYQRSMMRQGDRRLGLEEGAANRKLEQELATRNLALSLAGGDIEQQKLAVANPDKYLDFKVAQLKPDYKQREIKEGTQAYDEYSIDGGKTWEKVPGGGKYDLRAAKGGANIEMGVKTVEDFNEALAKKMSGSLVDQYDVLKTVPDVIQTLRTARDAAGKAQNFSGSAGEAKLAFAKLLNNNLGTQIDPEGVKNAEVLRSSTFRQIMDQLKKLDSQPTQKQQDQLKDALGQLATDPSALPEILQITEDILRTRVGEHNTRVRQAKEKKANFMYEIEIKLPGDEPTGNSTLKQKYGLE
jgi:hypothetical protein